MLRWRYHEEKEIVRKAKKGKKAYEDGWQRGNSPGSVYERAEAGGRLNLSGFDRNRYLSVTSTRAVLIVTDKYLSRVLEMKQILLKE
jgi:hypothetical protein